MPKGFLSLIGAVCLSGGVVVRAGVITDTTLMSVTGPSGLALANDGRVFVTQTNGQVRQYHNGVVTTLSLSLTNFANGGGEQGLIGIALDPANNNHLFLHYTSNQGGVVNRVSRYELSGTTLSLLNDVFLSEPGAGFNHRGGGMAFGSNGNLYVGLGDFQNPASAANSADFAGSITRITDLTAPGSASVYAQGLRNPFALAVQPGTGLLFINEVGTSGREEVNALAAGAPAGTHFGWPCQEGTDVGGPLSGNTSVCPGGATYTAPLFQYAHGTDNRCAITGGAFYNPSSPAALITNIGEYIFTDYCNGKFYSLNPVGAPAATEIYQRPGGLSSRLVGLATAANGNVYYLDGFTSTLGVLSAVPEPSTWSVMVLMLVAWVAGKFGRSPRVRAH